MSGSLQLFGVMMALTVPLFLILFVQEYFKTKRTTNSRFSQMKQELEERSTEELEKEVASLKERVIVLESIVTDRGFDLERKISSL